MVYITIVTGAYKPTYNWGASHCSKPLVCFWAPRLTQFADNTEMIIPAKSTEGFHLFLYINIIIATLRIKEHLDLYTILYSIPIERFPEIPKIGRYPQIIYFDMIFHYKPSSYWGTPIETDIYGAEKYPYQNMVKGRYHNFVLLVVCSILSP